MASARAVWNKAIIPLLDTLLITCGLAAPQGVKQTNTHRSVLVPSSQRFCTASLSSCSHPTLPWALLRASPCPHPSLPWTSPQTHQQSRLGGEIQDICKAKGKAMTNFVSVGSLLGIIVILKGKLLLLELEAKNLNKGAS